MFVAVARLADPDGAGKAPILIVGGSAKSRGVVCSASYEARAFGVRSGMPLSHAGRLCPSAVFVPVPRHLCGLKSREVARVLDRWAPKVEAASIDEFYLDLTGTEAVYRGEPLAQTAATIRTDLLERTGMTLSFGGGTNRLVAKLRPSEPSRARAPMDPACSSFRRARRASSSPPIRCPIFRGLVPVLRPGSAGTAFSLSVMPSGSAVGTSNAGSDPGAGPGSTIGFAGWEARKSTRMARPSR